MAKPIGAGEKTKETQRAGAKPVETKVGEAKAGEAKGSEAKKPEAKGHSESKAGGPRSKGHTALPGHCFSWECKAEADRFNFCNDPLRSNFNCIKVGCKFVGNFRANSLK